MCSCSSRFLFLSNGRQQQTKRNDDTHRDWGDTTEIQSMKMRQHFSAPLTTRISFFLGKYVDDVQWPSFIKSYFVLPRIPLLDAPSLSVLVLSLSLTSIDNFPVFPRFVISITRFFFFFFFFFSFYSFIMPKNLPSRNKRGSLVILDRYEQRYDTIWKELNSKVWRLSGEYDSKNKYKQLKLRRL